MLKKYGMVLNVSRIEPFQHLRDMLSFYTGEANRAHVNVALNEGTVRDLEEFIKKRRARILAGADRRAGKWRAEAEVEEDEKINDARKKISYLTTLIGLQKALRDGYYKNADLLSREQTARTNDRDRWYGKAGDHR